MPVPLTVPAAGLAATAAGLAGASSEKPTSGGERSTGAAPAEQPQGRAEAWWPATYLKETANKSLLSASPWRQADTRLPLLQRLCELNGLATEGVESDLEKRAMLGLHLTPQRLDNEIKALYLRQCKDNTIETVKSGLQKTSSLLVSSLSMLGLKTQDLQSKHRPQLLKRLCARNGLSDFGPEEILAKRLMTGMGWDYDQLRCKIDIEWRIQQQGMWNPINKAGPHAVPTTGESAASSAGEGAGAGATAEAAGEWDYVDQAACPPAPPSIKDIRMQAAMSGDVTVEEVISPTSTVSSYDLISDAGEEQEDHHDEVKADESTDADANQPKTEGAEIAGAAKDDTALHRSISEDSMDYGCGEAEKQQQQRQRQQHQEAQAQAQGPQLQ